VAVVHGDVRPRTPRLWGGVKASMIAGQA
jgi:hypothetical protein